MEEMKREERFMKFDADCSFTLHLKVGKVARTAGTQVHTL